MIYYGSDQIWSSLDHNKMSDSSSAASYKSSVKFQLSLQHSGVSIDWDSLKMNNSKEKKLIGWNYRLQILIAVLRTSLTNMCNAFRHGWGWIYNLFIKGKYEANLQQITAEVPLFILECLISKTLLVIAAEGYWEEAQITMTVPYKSPRAELRFRSLLFPDASEKEFLLKICEMAAHTF